MTAQDSRRVFLMGQRDALSFLDSKLANLAYHCSDRCTSPPLCFNEGYVNQFCKCTCADGFYGKQCELLQGYSGTVIYRTRLATRTVSLQPLRVPCPASRQRRRWRPLHRAQQRPRPDPQVQHGDLRVTIAVSLARFVDTTGLHWLEWNDWSNCSEPCGSGIRVRTRLCSNTSIQGSENPCATLGGGSFEIEACRNPDCQSKKDTRCSSLVNIAFIFQDDDIILSCTFDLDGEKCPSEDWAIRTGTQGDQTRPLGDHTRGGETRLLLT